MDSETTTTAQNTATTASNTTATNPSTLASSGTSGTAPTTLPRKVTNDWSEDESALHRNGDSESSEEKSHITNVENDDPVDIGDFSEDPSRNQLHKSAPSLDTPANSNMQTPRSQIQKPGDSQMLTLLMNLQNKILELQKSRSGSSQDAALLAELGTAKSESSFYKKNKRGSTLTEGSSFKGLFLLVKPPKVDFDHRMGDAPQH